ncbi:HEAT repeat domain-containing protein [Candidatus Magnetominusculus xianensis]|uniref:Magnetosome protein Mad23 n=1 Tax=Candidatus Magnetominusculus xianensis TaxID=1748249 RepID=A0ABR5SJN1_9BACT|nr:HEAT repeat domain-containing protein [Candidatus Magnetominusculus xianensis]KWT94844.1 magnetosome protein Mad23 [Candidatus Magnetominusculus xianensis]MBF0404736.1 HEAT repeat domain-containing protein [Nitrospirota bacterium]
MEEKRKGLWGAVAKALNATGAATVKSFDYTVDLFVKTTDAVKKATPGIVDTTVDYSKKTVDFLADGFSKVGELTSSIDFSAINFGKIKLSSISPGLGLEKDDLRDKITEYEGKIKNLYFEIGKEGASADKLESDKVRQMIEDVKEFEKEIQRLRGRILELEEKKREDSLRKSEPRTETKQKKKKQKLSETQVDALLKSAIEKALKHGSFETDSDKAIFNKIANDLLDIEMDVKILAATELGKMGNKAAVDVLLEAVKYRNKYLAAEAINSLINIGDPKAVELCKDMAGSSNHKVRVNSLRGLYKLGKDDEIIPYLMEALKDEHAEVRRTAVTFLGWKDCVDAVPGLVQSLQDKDDQVRKAAVSALANIKDTAAVLPLMRTLADEAIEIRQKSLEAIKMITAKDVAFNIELTGEALTKAVNELKNWWQRERMDGIGEAVTEQYADVAAPDTRPMQSSYQHYSEETPVEPAASYTVDTPEPVDEVAEPAAEPAPEPVGEAAEPAAPGRTEMPTQSELKRMSKAELISLCQASGIDCDDTYTKSELINLLNV